MAKNVVENVVRTAQNAASTVETLAGLAPGQTAEKVAAVAGAVGDAAAVVQSDFLPALDKVKLSLQKVDGVFHATVTVNDRETVHKGACLDTILKDVKDAFRRFGAILPKTKTHK